MSMLHIWTEVPHWAFLYPFAQCGGPVIPYSSHLMFFHLGAYDVATLGFSNSSMLGVADSSKLEKYVVSRVH